MDRLSRRHFLRAASGIFVPALLLTTKADLVLPGPIMRTMAPAVSPCTTQRDVFDDVDTSIEAVGNSAARKNVGVRFTASANYTSCKSTVELDKTGSPSGSITAHIYSDSSGSPNAVLASSSSVLCSSISTKQYYELTNLALSISSGTVYWLVIRMSVVGDASNYIRWYYTTISNPGFVVVKRCDLDTDGATWSTVSSILRTHYAIYS